MNEPLRKTLVDAVALLEAHGIAYALIGGLAVSLRAQPRATVDVDMVIAADVDGALRLLDALDGTEFRPLFDDVKEVVERSFILPLRHCQTKVKVDLAVGLSGFERQAVARAKPLKVAGTAVAVVTAEDLLIMKVLAGRPQDVQDAQGLVIAQGEQIDWDYCLRVAAELEQAIEQPLVQRINDLRRALS